MGIQRRMLRVLMARARLLAAWLMVDSAPVVTALSPRWKSARMSIWAAEVGYCASKQARPLVQEPAPARKTTRRSSEGPPCCRLGLSFRAGSSRQSPPPRRAYWPKGRSIGEIQARIPRGRHGSTSLRECHETESRSPAPKTAPATPSEPFRSTQSRQRCWHRPQPCKSSNQ